MRHALGRHVAPVALLLLLGTCSGADNVVVEADGQAVIPSGGVLEELLGELEFAGFDDVEVSQSEELANEGYDADDIDSVHLLSVALSISAPSGGTFDFLDEIAFFVEAEGQPRAEIARLDAIPAGASTLELVVDGSVELRPYVVAPTMIVTSEATGRRPDEDTTIDAHLAFDVDIDVSGAACATAR